MRVTPLISVGAGSGPVCTVLSTTGFQGTTVTYIIIVPLLRSDRITNGFMQIIPDECQLNLLCHNLLSWILDVSLIVQERSVRHVVEDIKTSYLGCVLDSPAWFLQVQSAWTWLGTLHSHVLCECRTWGARTFHLALYMSIKFTLKGFFLKYNVSFLSKCRLFPSSPNLRGSSSDITSLL